MACAHHPPVHIHTATSRFKWHQRLKSALWRAARLFQANTVGACPQLFLSSSHCCAKTRSKWHHRRKGALERIAAACPQLAELDCAGARNLTGEHLEAAAAGGGLSRLTRLALGRCDAVQRAGPLLATLGCLVALDLSYTGVQACELQSLILTALACLCLACAHCLYCCPRGADLSDAGVQNTRARWRACLVLLSWGLVLRVGAQVKPRTRAGMLAWFGSCWHLWLRRLHVTPGSDTLHLA